MKPSLQLKLGQQLAMTPQLQQAIRLLQLSSLELQQEIQLALEKNPLLEQEDLTHESENEAGGNLLDQTLANFDAVPENDNDGGQLNSTELLAQQTIPDELPVDTTWDEAYSASTEIYAHGLDDEFPVYQGETTQTLQDHLLWQLRLTPFSEIDRAIATAIIDAVNEQGYLTVSTQEILESLGLADVELDEVEAVLKRVQQFDPLSVASRNLQECLLLQLAALDANTPWLNEAKLILQNYMHLLANRDFSQLIKESKLNDLQLRSTLELVHTLEPRPGNLFNHEEPEYVLPDVFVSKEKNQWIAQINIDNMPRLKVNQQYAALSKGSCSASDSLFIRNHLQEAKWFIKSLESRNETLLKVSRYIVDYQKDFFEYGAERMKPMILSDVAGAVEMHESTISRVTTQKYMHTPHGIFELKYFFSSHVSTESGGECSSTAIRALVKKLVAAENSQKPLSDSKIATLLAQQGIQVARRTIAKYRESLGIAPSSQRKRLF